MTEIVKKKRLVSAVLVSMICAFASIYLVRQLSEIQPHVSVELQFSGPLDLDESLLVIIRNDTGDVVQFPNPSSQFGKQAFGLDFFNLDTGEVFHTRWDDTAVNALEPLGDYRWELIDKPEFIEIGPEETFSFRIHLHERLSNRCAWSNRPIPNTEDDFLILPVIQFQAERDFLIKCVGQQSHVVSPLLKGPSEYLNVDFDNQALTLLKADPHLLRACEDARDSPLIVAAKLKKAEVAQQLLELGANVNAKDLYGRTAAHFLMDTATANVLLNADPDLSIRERESHPLQGETAFGAACRRLIKGLRTESEKELAQVVMMFHNKGEVFDLKTAVYFGDLDRVKQILEANHDSFYSHYVDEYDWLHPYDFAFQRGDLQICEYLLERGLIELNERNGLLGSLLVESVAHADVVELLLGYGVSVHGLQPTGGLASSGPPQLVPRSSPILHYAASQGYVDTIDVLLDHQADVFEVNMQSREAYQLTPIEIAIRCGHVTAARNMINHESFQFENDAMRFQFLNRLLQTAVLKDEYNSGNRDSIEMIRELVWMGADPDFSVDGKSLSHWFCIQPRFPKQRDRVIDVVRLLQKLGASENLATQVVLGKAKEIARVFESNGKHVLSDNLTSEIELLQLAVKFDRPDCIRELERAGFQIDLRDSNPIFEAIEWKSVNSLEALLDLGVNVNGRNSNLRTPLHMAVWKNNVGMTRLLLKYGADPTLEDEAGAHPFSNLNADPETAKEFGLIYRESMNRNKHQRQGG